MIAIVDYGLGNVGAFSNMYKRMGVPAKIAKQADELSGATHLILPGVGSFDHAMHLLQESGMREKLDTLVLDMGLPVLGVCVGMQILAETSDEGASRGLGWIKGRVKALSSHRSCIGLPMPHMGWNDVDAIADGGLLKGMKGDARFYFLHSYYFECDDADDIAATAQYGFDFACAVRKNNVYGAQFHPEKSHHWGAALLKNFAEV